MEHVKEYRLDSEEEEEEVVVVVAADAASSSTKPMKDKNLLRIIVQPLLLPLLLSSVAVPAGSVSLSPPLWDNDDDVATP